MSCIERLFGRILYYFRFSVIASDTPTAFFKSSKCETSPASDRVTLSIPKIKTGAEPRAIPHASCRSRRSNAPCVAVEIYP